ncbi:hypothetical protein Efla_004841 [Eimeria flavescens]
MADKTEFVGLKLKEVLDKLGVNPDLKVALPGIFKECCSISKALRTTKVTSAGSSNTFGEEQLSVDLLAESKLKEWAKSCSVVRAISSEEATDLVEVNPSGSLLVCWDPLDGSSIVDCNWSVASIFGIWQLNACGALTASTGLASFVLPLLSGRQQVASLLVIYGPRTTALLCVGARTLDFQLDCEGNDHVVIRGPCNIKKEGAKIFSPANLRAAQDLPPYDEMVKEWMKKRYTLRGLGPDVYQIFVKGHGIFCNPASAGAPAKLRIVYEVAPMALLVEAAGGCTSDGKGSALDVSIEKMDQRTAFCCGTEEEVRKFECALRR